MMMEWTTTLSLSGRMAKMGYENRHVVQKYWTMAKAALDLGATQIVVTGHSGAGKSVLTGQIHGSARDLYFETPAESLSTEVEAITLGEWTKLVRVLPGQKARRVKGEIEAFQDNPSLEGVIHVVDFGYVSPRDPVYVQTLIEHDKLVDVQTLRDRNIKLEINDLNDVLSNIRRLHQLHSRPKWLIIAVNKVDLYPTDMLKALTHYHPNGQSDFSRTLADFQHEIGSQNLGIYVSQVCAHEIDFSWNGQVVPSTLPRQQQNAILREFAKTISTLTAIHQ